jgi:hypothetical protein
MNVSSLANLIGRPLTKKYVAPKPPKEIINYKYGKQFK